MAKNMSVARVVQHTSASIGKAERHTERKNESYENLNVNPDRISMNIHFKDPGEESYMEILRRKEEEGSVSTRGLRQDATLFDEMIIDVNTMYFEEHGGYDFAKQFYEEAFHFAEQKYGSENIVSAVMHADEINQAATEELGYPVYHYHMHIIAMPVVEKEVRWTKRCKDPELVGTVKEVIHQISHSKKWESRTPELDDNGDPVLRANGKPRYIKSYSVLQDELFEHMQGAGFRDFERGERGSTAQHLSSLQYQYQKDLERKAELENAIESETLQYDDTHKDFMNYAEIDAVGRKKSITGKVIVTADELETLKSMARTGISGRAEIRRLRDDKEQLNRKISNLYKSVSNLERRLDELQEKCRPFLEALEHFPDLAKAFAEKIRELVELKKERSISARTKQHKRTHDEWTR